MIVLILERATSLRSRFVRELEEAGFSVVTTESAEWALRFALGTRPSAIAVAASLPGMEGRDFVRFLRMSDLPYLRAVPVVGLASGLQVNRAFLAAGADCTVQRIVGRRDIVKSVRWAIDVYGARQAVRWLNDSPPDC